MKIISFIVILGFISCTTYDNVYDVWYNYEYPLIDNYQTGYNEYDFRLAVNPTDKMDMEIKIPKDDVNYFSISVYEFNYNPSSEEIIGNKGTPKTMNTRTAYSEGEYTVYPFQVQASIYGKYFGIHVISRNYFKYSYLVFRINLALYKYSNIKDLNFNENYEFPMSTFGDGKIPPHYQIYIRLAAIEEDNMEVQLTTHKTYDSKNAFQVNVCQYTYKPTYEQVYYPTYDSLCKEPLTNESKEDMKYNYPFTTDKDTTYLSIRIIYNLEIDLEYLFILIYSEKGLAAAIIAVIVIVPLLIIGGLVFFLLKKCGCIK